VRNPAAGATPAKPDSGGTNLMLPLLALLAALAIGFSRRALRG
jgi:hypothetical protein